MGYKDIKKIEMTFNGKISNEAIKKFVNILMTPEKDEEKTSVESDSNKENKE